MTQLQPSHRIDVPFLLHAAGLLPGDPQVDDLGPLFAAVARMYACSMDRDVYESDHLKAAALLHTLVKLPALEHSGEAFAWHSTEAFLALAGHHLDYPPKGALVLVQDIGASRIGVAGAARQLDVWTVRPGSGTGSGT